MTDEARRALNDARLGECYPTFAARIRTLLAALEADGFRPRIQCAWRSPAEQAEAKRTGRSKLAFGFHNVTGTNGQPEALAVDVLDDDAPLEPTMRYLVALAIAARRVGCQTGILWGLPPRLQTQLDAAIDAGDLAAAAAFEKRGWDPCHVEPRFLSVTGARHGDQRPGPWPPTRAS